MTTAHKYQSGKYPALLVALLLLFSQDAFAAECNGCHAKSYETILSNDYIHASATDMCAKCHVYSKPLVKDAVASEHGYGLIPPLKAGIDVCKSCHVFFESHPVGIKSSGVDIAMPKRLPTINGVITCATCHSSHGGSRQYLTRLDWERELCIECHVSETFAYVKVCRKLKV